MTIPDILFETDIASLPLIHRGKVRDIYKVDSDTMLIVTSDRLSAFDVVLPTPIPGKGAVLTDMANFWFKRTANIIPNHLSSMTLEQALPNKEERQQVEGRAIVVNKLNALPIEAIVRGYLIGSGWKDYKKNGAVCGIVLPEGLKQAEKLPEPIYTPSTKADVGDHDENVSFEYTVDVIGPKLAEQVRDVSIRLYREASQYALARGIIIADTKFEFGLDKDERLTLIDEVLTPDSSRFWPADRYQIGTSPESFDKQYVRDYLETLEWDKTDPGPVLPQDIVRQTSEKYRQALQQLTA